jgi:hypothetical protein
MSVFSFTRLYILQLGKIKTEVKRVSKVHFDFVWIIGQCSKHVKYIYWSVLHSSWALYYKTTLAKSVDFMWSSFGNLPFSQLGVI